MTPRELEMCTIRYKISQLQSGSDIQDHFGKLVLLLVGAILLAAGKTVGIIPIIGALIFWYWGKYQTALDTRKVRQYDRELEMYHRTDPAGEEPE